MDEQSIETDAIDRLARRKSLGVEVFEILRDRIIAGEYNLGAWLRQEDIARRFGVSQTPVREALDRLVAEGLVERVPYRGVRVARLTDEEIADIYAVRMVLEAVVVRAVAYNIVNQQLSESARQRIGELERLVDEIEGLTRLEKMARRRELNLKFHLTLAEASGNQVLERLYEMTLHQFPDWMIYEGMFRQEEQLEARLAREVGEHRRILEAIKVGEAELAAEIAREHVSNLRDELVELLGVNEKLLEEKTRWLEGQWKRKDL